MSPADVTALLLWLELQDRQAATTTSPDLELIDRLVRSRPILTSSTLPDLHQRHCRHLAYWELRAEEVMDRVFAAVNPLNSQAMVIADAPVAPQEPATAAAPSPWRQRRWWLLLGALCLLSSSVAVTAGLLWRGWMQARDELQHQRQLQLIERLKPASEPAPAPAPMPPCAWKFRR